MKQAYIIIALLVFSFSAQGQKIRLSGIVVDGQSKETIPGVTIINNNQSSGAVTDSLGFFSLQVVSGDTVQFVDIRYKNTSLVVPYLLKDQGDYGIIQVMVQDEVVLDEITVFAFPSNQEFKEAFMSLNLPKSQIEQNADLNRDVMALVKQQYQEDKTYYQMWSNRRLYEMTGIIGPNNFINPTSWSNFFYELKKNRAKLEPYFFTI